MGSDLLSAIIYVQQMSVYKNSKLVKCKLSKKNWRGADLMEWPAPAGPHKLSAYRRMIDVLWPT